MNVKENRKIRLAALDMDGTLLMPDKSIHPDTKRDIEAASGKGIVLAYCSGRAVVELLEYHKQLPSMRYAVCLNGSHIHDFQENKGIYTAMIAKEWIERIVEEGVRFEAMVHLLSPHQSILQEDTLDHIADFHMAPYEPAYRREALLVKDIREEAARFQGIPKINIYFRSLGDRSEAYKKLIGEQLPLSICYEEETALSFTSRGVNKGTGLSALGALLGISMEETMMVGDDYNDEAALRVAGLSVAMKNANAQIRQMCDVVTGDNAHNGAGEAIRRYCL